MKTNQIIVLIIISFFTFFKCSPESVDLSIDAQWVCWTVLDSSNDEPIYGAITNVTVRNISDKIVELTYYSNPNGETCFSSRFGGTILYAKISAEGYATKIYENGNIPNEVKLSPI